MKNLLALILVFMTVNAEARTAYNVYRMPSSGNIPGWGAIDLSQSGAVTGVLPNANTTATAANTPSTIMLRDGSGQVAATTFTGALSGNATSATTATTAGTVTTNANLTGPITSTGNATAVAAQTGTGSTFVMQASPTLTTPNIGLATTSGEITLAQVSTPSTPASGFNKVYPKSDGKFYNLNSAGVETQIGSGSGGINYISANPDFESSTTGWVTFLDAANSSPTDGTGGSPVGTFTRSTSSPLRGVASGVYSKGNATSVVGEGISYDFTIDPADQAKVMKVEFDYSSTLAFAAGNSTTDSTATVWLYDITNAQVIQPTTYKFYSTSGHFITNFQTNSNSTSYRLIIYNGQLQLSAYTIKVDGFVVTPSQYTYGTPITDWQSFTVSTVTTQGFGTVSAATGFWRRVGGNKEYNVNFISTVPTGVEARVNLDPGSTTADSTRLVNATTLVGYTSQSGSGAIAGTVLAEASKGYLTFGIQGASNGGTTKANGNLVVASGNIYSFFASVPIQGINSTTQMSDSADSRTVAMRYTGNAGTVLTANVTNIDFSTKVQDTHGAWNGTTYTTPVPGFYNILGSFQQTASSAGIVQAYVNGTQTASLSSSNSTTIKSVVGTLYLNAGDLLTFRSTGSDTLNNNAVNHFISINRVAGPETVSATEKILVIAYLAANQAVTANNPVKYDTVLKDTHGAYSTSTGKFTCPVSGDYQISGSGSTTSGTSGWYIMKNSTKFQYLFTNTNSSPFGGSGAVSCNTGDTLQVNLDSSLTATGGAAPYFTSLTISLIK